MECQNCAAELRSDDPVCLHCGEPTGFADAASVELTSLLAAIRPLVEEYSQWNCWDRNDGTMYHTDCLEDFLDWLERKSNG